MKNTSSNAPSEIVNNSEKIKKPSRGWIIYHLMGGIALRVCGESSGLIEYILSFTAPKGADPYSASVYASIATAITVGTIALGYYLSKILIQRIVGSNIRALGKNILIVILPIAYFAVSGFLAFTTKPSFPLLDSSNGISPKTTQTSEVAPVITFTTSQSSEGVKESDLDQTALKNLENYMVSRLITKGKENYQNLGYNANNYSPAINSNSLFVTVKGKKLAVIRANVDNSMRMVSILRIVDGEMYRVNCIRNSNDDIPVWSGECGKQIEETFGVNLLH